MHSTAEFVLIVLRKCACMYDCVCMCATALWRQQMVVFVCLSVRLRACLPATPATQPTLGHHARGHHYPLSPLAFFPLSPHLFVTILCHSHHLPSTVLTPSHRTPAQVAFRVGICGTANPRSRGTIAYKGSMSTWHRLGG